MQTLSSLVVVQAIASVKVNVSSTSGSASVDATSVSTAVAKAIATALSEVRDEKAVVWELSCWHQSNAQHLRHPCLSKCARLILAS